MGIEFLMATVESENMGNGRGEVHPESGDRLTPALRVIDGGASSTLLEDEARVQPFAPLCWIPARDVPVVLAADAGEKALSMLVLALSGEFDLVRARDGETALRLALIGHPDLVLLDVHMPKLDGYRVTAQIRRNPATCDTPVILLAANPERIDVLRGCAAGADDYISKPFDPVELLERVHNALGATESAG
jgi:CheY-like chemotaxis protein